MSEGKKTEEIIKEAEELLSRQRALLSTRVKSQEKELKKLDTAYAELAKPLPFNKDEHDSNSRKEITKLFLKWYFGLIAGAFAFCGVYNGIASQINEQLMIKAHSINLAQPELIPYLDLSNTVAIITTTLSSGVGFVIGYYFKNKGES